MPPTGPYDTGLDPCPANYTPLSPLSLLARTAHVYPARTAVVYGARRLTWREVYARCRRLASALARAGAGLSVSCRRCSGRAAAEFCANMRHALQ